MIPDNAKSGAKGVPTNPRQRTAISTHLNKLRFIYLGIGGFKTKLLRTHNICT